MRKLLCFALLCFTLQHSKPAVADEYEQFLQVLCAPELETLRIESISFNKANLQSTDLDLYKNKYNLFKRVATCEFQSVKYVIKEGSYRNSILIEADGKAIADIKAFWDSVTGVPQNEMELTIGGKYAPSKIELVIKNAEQKKLIAKVYDINRLKEHPLTWEKIISDQEHSTKSKTKF